MQATNQNK